MLVCRLLPWSIADGPHNMAADEVLLESAAKGIASLRFYGWSTATLSLGYFQPEAVRRRDLYLAGLPYVRRPSGGDTLLHDREVTYALALPAGAPWQTGEPWLRRMHTILAAALGELGIPVRLHEPGEAHAFSGFLCFQHVTPGDLLLGSAKVGGSAQRRQRRALLQHGAVLLAASPHTPVLPGIHELTGRRLSAAEVCAAIQRIFQRETGWSLEAVDWLDTERQRLEELAIEKYASDAWNHKR